MPLCASILHHETCQILSVAENPRWCQVWQYSQTYYYILFEVLTKDLSWQFEFFEFPFIKCELEHLIFSHSELK